MTETSLVKKENSWKIKKSDAWVCGGSRACGAAVVGGGSRALLVAGGRGCCGSAAQPARLGHGQLAAAGGRGCRLPCETLLQPHTTRSRSDRGDSLHCQYIFREVCICIFVSFLNSVNRYKTIQLLYAGQLKWNFRIYDQLHSFESCCLFPPAFFHFDIHGSFPDQTLKPLVPLAIGWQITQPITSAWFNSPINLITVRESKGQLG